jgi:hypothetical protein
VTFTLVQLAAKILEMSVTAMVALRLFLFVSLHPRRPRQVEPLLQPFLQHTLQIITGEANRTESFLLAGVPWLNRLRIIS